MKKLLLLGFAALLFAACGKDDDTTTQEEQIRKKLIAHQWEKYGTTYVNEHTNVTDYIWIPNEDGNTCYWTFTESTYSLDCNNIKNEPYSIKEDTFRTKYWVAGIQFAGDSCILTTPKAPYSTYIQHSVTVLYPKGHKK